MKGAVLPWKSIFSSGKQLLAHFHDSFHGSETNFRESCNSFYCPASTEVRVAGSVGFRGSLWEPVEACGSLWKPDGLGSSRTSMEV